VRIFKTSGAAFTSSFVADADSPLPAATIWYTATAASKTGFAINW